MKILDVSIKQHLRPEVIDYTGKKEPGVTIVKVKKDIKVIIDV